MVPKLEVLLQAWIKRGQIHRQRRDCTHSSSVCAALVGRNVESLEARLCLSTIGSQTPLASQSDLVGDGFSETVVASGLSGATAMEFSPDGKLFIAEEAGTLEVWDNNVRLQADFFRDVPLNTQTVSERGLLGIAFDPDYATNRYVYVYYTTTAADNHNRVSRFTADAAGELAQAGSEQIIMELDSHSAGNHNGGAMHFGLDGMLYVAVGDNANGANSQSLANRHGKMLRIDVDGDDFADTGQNYRIPADNPTTFPGITGSTSGFNQSIWAVGLRNPFTFSVQPGTGRIFINDVGQNTWEEINDGGAGLNYGWSTTEGDFNPATFPNFTRPFYTYDQEGDEPNGCAITGGAFYNPATNQFPAEFQGDYFFSDFCGNSIWHIDLATKEVNEFATDISAPVDLKVDGQGNLYYLARGSGQVVQVSFQLANIMGTDINGVANANRSGINALTLTFDRNVTIDLNTSLDLFNQTTGLPVDVSNATLVNNGTMSVTWDLSDVTFENGHYTAELPASATTPALAQSYSFQFHVLAGDVDGNALVNFDDYFAVRDHFNTSGENYAPGDADGNGLVNFDDYFVVRDHFNSFLEPIEINFSDAPDAVTFHAMPANNGPLPMMTGNDLSLGVRDAEADRLPAVNTTGDDLDAINDEDNIAIGVLERSTSAGVTLSRHRSRSVRTARR